MIETVASFFAVEIIVIIVELVKTKVHFIIPK